MDMINVAIDSLIRGTSLGVSLVLCGYGLWSIGTFMVKMARRFFKWMTLVLLGE